MKAITFACWLFVLSALVVSCGAQTRLDPPPTPTAAPTVTFDLPAGYIAYPNVTVVIVDIAPDGTQGAAAQEAVISEAMAQKIDVLVLGCIAVDASASVCPGAPFIVFGSRPDIPAGAKRAKR